MLYTAFVGVFFISAVLGEYPIIELKPDCAPTMSDSPGLQLIADVPAYGLALCENGEIPLVTESKAVQILQGTYDQGDGGGGCIFHYSKANNSFTVLVEVGWGETDQSYSRSRVHVVSCTYDQQGKLEGSTQTISDWHKTSRQNQPMLEESHVTSNIQLKILDDLENDVTWSTIPVGKKIRLLAYDSAGETDIGFRPLSCIAQNIETNYAILSEGCGDGFVLDKTVGFKTNGNKIYSPYFDAFRLRGEDSVHFVCNFTICPSTCDDDSCLIQTRVRRQLSDNKENKTKKSAKVILIHSDPVRTTFMETKNVLEQKDQSPPLISSDISDFLLHLGSLNRGYPSRSGPEVVVEPQTQSLRTELFITMTVFGVILLFTFIFSLYLCCKYEIARPRLIRI